MTNENFSCHAAAHPARCTSGDEEVVVSFVIPALNEAGHISRTLESIQQKMRGLPRFEVIVADHGSCDGTAAIAEAAGTKVIVTRDAVTIGALRNLGAAYARGKVLVFIDADVALTGQWHTHFPATLERLGNNPTLVTGSHCAAPESGNWLERHWFGAFAQQPQTSHIGTGHMIMNAAFFQRLGGFSERLETGEDYEFSRRAQEHGAVILNQPDLRTDHYGYPKNLASLVRREAWHGKGDLGSVATYIHSKVALAATLFVLLHALLIAGLLMWNFAVAGVGAMALAALLIASSVMRYRHASLKTMVINSIVFYFYYLGRSLSFLYTLSMNPGRRTRPHHASG